MRFFWDILFFEQPVPLARTKRDVVSIGEEARFT